MADALFVKGIWDDYGPLPKGYERKLQPIPDQGMYWHLFYYGDRVNGGLQDTEVAAITESRRLAWVHQWHRAPRAPLSERAQRIIRSLRYGDEPPWDEWEWDD